MVEEKIIEGKKYFICEGCSLVYKDKEWAVKCQDWCRETQTCSIEITKHAIKD